MPVRRTLMPVVEPVAIQEAKLEVQGTIQHLIALGDLSYSIVPSNAQRAEREPWAHPLRHPCRSAEELQDTCRIRSWSGGMLRAQQVAIVPASIGDNRFNVV